MRRWLCLLIAALVLMPLAAGCGEDLEVTEILPREEYAFSGKVVRKYESDTLVYTVEKFREGGCLCYLSKVWVEDPASQIVKETAAWKENIQLPRFMAQRIPEAALIVNGSGYVSPTYPWIPENYPGESEDYYFTPLGSLTVTNGEVFRDLTGVPYYGLTLEADGLHMYVGAENGDVLAGNPTQTWSFYVNCPMLLNNEDILPEEWDFADRPAMRTVIARVNRNNYLLLTVTNDGKRGLSLRDVSLFFREHFDTEWVYDLDGGPSSALMVRRKGKKAITTLWGGKAKDADILGFREKPE